jgi:hypothetical protein
MPSLRPRQIKHRRRVVFQEWDFTLEANSLSFNIQQSHLTTKIIFKNETLHLRQVSLKRGISDEVDFKVLEAIVTA